MPEYDTVPTILFVHHSNDLYGPDLVLLQTLSGLDRSRYTPLVVLPDDCPVEGGLGAELEKLGVPFQFCPLAISRRRYLKPTYLLRHLLSFVRSVRFLVRLIRERKIAIVHSNTLAVCSGAVAANITGTPHIWHVHEMLVSPAGIRQVLHVVAPRLSTVVVCNSESVKRHMLQGRTKYASRYVVVHNGLHAEAFLAKSDGQAIRREFGIPLDAPLIGMIGRLNPGKGQVVLARAAKNLLEEFPDAYFFVAGSEFGGMTDYSNALKLEIEKAGIASRFLLSDYRKDVPDILSALDVYVHPSLHPEGFGLAVLEAMIAGKAIVATAHGGPLEMIEDGVSGYLVPPGDAAALAERMAECLRDRSGSQEMGQRAQARALEMFTAERYLDKMHAVYDKALKSPSESHEQLTSAYGGATK